MKKLLAALLIAALALLAAVPALAEGYRMADGNVNNYAALLKALLEAYETPAATDEARIDGMLEAITANSAPDGEVARAIAEHWRAVYLDPDYLLHLYQNDGQAAALLEDGLADSADHAFVVLGYELKDGGMTNELIGRCEAAAAAARAFPSAFVVCSGGATGDNNPDRHTEAGLMKAYLSEQCGIDPSWILIDERAMTTLENAVNTFAMLREKGVRTFTIVTSAYHQRWGQVLYNAMAALYRQAYGYSAQLVSNFSFDIEPSNPRYLQDDRIAIRQLADMLKLPKDALE